MSYVEFDNMVDQFTDGTANASEAHGHLIGLLCAHSGDVVAPWVNSLAALSRSDANQDNAQKNPTSLIAGDQRTADELAKLAAQLTKKVSDGDLEFVLMLPDDDESLADRVDALAHWCQGFLFGLAEGGVRRFEGLPGDCTEILADISELTNVTADDADEQAEQDFFELSEYVRVGTQLIYEEICGLGQSASGTSH